MLLPLRTTPSVAEQEGQLIYTKSVSWQHHRQPQDIANAALFLCSPAASWVSGQILTVSGGGVQELN
ncbi:SDR family oxidoreductase [Escherichia coli]